MRESVSISVFIQVIFSDRVKSFINIMTGLLLDSQIFSIGYLSLELGRWEESLINKSFTMWSINNTSAVNSFRTCAYAKIPFFSV